MQNLLAALKGKKTYAMCALGAVVVLVHFLGYLNLADTNTLLGLLGFGGLAALRSSVN